MLSPPGLRAFQGSSAASARKLGKPGLGLGPGQAGELAHVDLPEKRRGGDGEAEDLGEGLGGLAGPPQIRGVEAVKAYAAAAEALGEAEGLPDTHGGEGDV